MNDDDDGINRQMTPAVNKENEICNSVLDFTFLKTPPVNMRMRVIPKTENESAINAYRCGNCNCSVK